MKIYTNEKLIARNAKIARYTSLAGLAVLLIGLVISFVQPNRQDLVPVSFGALILGFILSQVGIYYTNRWGRKPRPDEVLTQSLKGLDNKYALFHFTTPVAHLLVGPAGLWVLSPRHQRGTITFTKGRYRQRGGGLMQAYLRAFAQEGLGRPDLEVAADIENIQKELAAKLPEGSAPPVKAALVFLNPAAEIAIEEDENPPATAIQVAKLKEFIRKTAKTKPVSMESILLAQKVLAGEATPESTETEEE